jgi:ribosomal protein S27E
MKINCPGCGHRIELDDAYDDYEGQIRCWVCGTIFEIRTEDGCVKAVRSREFAPSPSRE